MRTLTRLVGLVLAMMLVAGNGWAEELPRTQRVIMLGEAMLREHTAKELRFISALNAEFDELFRARRGLGRVVTSASDLNDLFLVVGVGRCASGSEKTTAKEAYVKCLSQLPIKVYMNAALNEEGLLKVDRYDYQGIDAFVAKHFETVLDFSDEDRLKQQAKNLLVCHAYFDEFDAATVNAACSAIAENAIVLAPWKPSPDAAMVVPQETVPPVEGQKSVVAKKPIPVGKIAFAGLVASSVPMGALGVLMMIGAMTHGMVSMAAWKMLDDRAEDKRLSPSSGYRANLAQSRNMDLTFAFVVGALGSTFMFICVGLLGVAGAWLVSYFAGNR